MRVEFDNAVLEAKYGGLEFAPVFDRVRLRYDAPTLGHVVTADRGGHRANGTIARGISLEPRYLNGLLRKMDEQLWTLEHAEEFRNAARGYWHTMKRIQKHVARSGSPWMHEHEDAMWAIGDLADEAVEKHGPKEFVPRPWYVREKEAE